MSNPVQLVIGNGDLVSNILSYCWHQSSVPGDKHLKKIALVNRLFRALALRVLFARVSFDQYSAYHPSRAPTEAMAVSFDYLRDCVKTIEFESALHLYQQLPFFFLGGDHGGSLRYLHFKTPGEEIRVNLKSSTISLRSTAILDGDNQVHVKSIFTKCREHWPKSFKVVRTLELFYFGSNPFTKYNQDKYGNRSRVGAPEAKIRSLDDIMNDAAITDDLDDNIRNDRDYIQTAHILEPLDTPTLEHFLAYPLQRLQLYPNILPRQDISKILSSANLLSLHFGRANTWANNRREWSASRIFHIIQEYAKVQGSIHKLKLNFDMSASSLGELRKLANADIGSKTVIPAFPESRPPARLELLGYYGVLRAGNIVDLQEIFPQWEWKNHFSDSDKLKKGRLELAIFCCH